MKQGVTLLHRMCWAGNDDSTDLIERVCEAVPEHINAKDKFGQTPLHYWSNRRETISIGRCLLKRGADINAKDAWGSTPIICASKVKDEKAIEFLLQQGAVTHHKDKDGKDLLDWCKENGLKYIEALLLSKR